MWLHLGVLREYGLKYIDEVISHEFAHVVVSHLYLEDIGENGREIRHHGKEFKKVCKMLGFEGKRTTSLFTDSYWIQRKKGYKGFHIDVPAENTNSRQSNTTV